MTSWLPSKGRRKGQGPARTGNLGRFCSGSYERWRGATTVRPQLVPIAGRRVDHRSAVSERCSPRDQLGTTRYARCRTTCTSVNVTHHGLAAKTVGDLGKRATATSWGSSGRRFKSCQPDAVLAGRRLIGGPRPCKIGYPVRVCSATAIETMFGVIARVPRSSRRPPSVSSRRSCGRRCRR